MKKFKFRSVIALANSKLSVQFAATLLASSTLISALLGIFRDRLLNSYYLNTYPSGIDAYTVAFTIPDFMYFILVSGALAVTFIPVFNQRLIAGNKKSAWELSSSTLNIMALVTLVASILIMIFADPLIRYIVGPGLNEAAMSLAINMMRVIAINPFLFAIATVVSSIQQAVGRFFFCALAPAIYNIGIIIGIVWFTGGINIFGIQIFEGGIMGVALGVVLGAVLQLLVSLIGLFGLGFDYEFKIHWKNMGFKAVLGLLPARSLDQGLDYVDGIVKTNLASHMGPGVIRSYQQANTLRQMPVNLIGVAIATAFFPQMTEEIGAGNEEKFRATLRSALRMIIFTSLPVAAVAYFARGYVVNFIVNGGNALISDILAAFIATIFFSSVFHIATRGFYARQDTKTPLVVSIIAIGLNIALAIIFSNVFSWGPEGLALATVIGSALEAIILLFLLQKSSGWILLNTRFWNGVGRMLLATLIASIVSYAMTKWFPLLESDDSFFVTFPKFVLIATVGLLAYAVACYVLQLDEIRPLIDRIKKVVFRNAK